MGNTQVEKPFGHVAVFTVRKKGSGFLSTETERKTIHRKGRRQLVESAARLTPRFVEIVRIDALTEEEWARVIGIGRER